MMKKVALIGAGPTGIYTLLSLIYNSSPLEIYIYEQNDVAGVGMPYSRDDNAKIMLANIASIEIPPLVTDYIDWLNKQPADYLATFGINADTLHKRQFLPRILLGDYFRAQFLALIEQARQRGFDVVLAESTRVTDLQCIPSGVALWANKARDPRVFDLAILATGHQWPQRKAAIPGFFPSPWSGLAGEAIPACRVGILGTSLSGIDAAMAVVAQHGVFTEHDDGELTFTLDAHSRNLTIVLMSRSGILPEADFYCPIPYEPLQIATESAIASEIAAGATGLLDRIFSLMVEELVRADPQWSHNIALSERNVDTFADAWFKARRIHDPFHWAEYNLNNVEYNKRQHITVPWRYTILRLHEAVEDIVPHLDERDNERFSSGLARVFIDNYAAIPSQSIRRLLALRSANIIDIVALGNDYRQQIEEHLTRIVTEGETYLFDIFVDARGQRPLKISELPFPTLRKQLSSTGKDFPEVGRDYTLQAPPEVRGRIALGAIPYLMHDKPFIQGIVGCAEIGAAIAGAVAGLPSGVRKWLPNLEV